MRFEIVSARILRAPNENQRTLQLREQRCVAIFSFRVRARYVPAQAGVNRQLMRQLKDIIQVVALVVLLTVTIHCGLEARRTRHGSNVAKYEIGKGSCAGARRRERTAGKDTRKYEQARG